MKHTLPDASFFICLKKIYAGMDEQYRRVSEQYGFNCRGCDDNCCETLFFHHTYLEFFYLMQGVEALPADIRKPLFERAEAAGRKTSEAGNRKVPFRIMCPLNMEGLCMLYDRRPMICRMHGIPHELRPPGRQAAFGPGCGAFSDQCSTEKYFPFDRTPFYMEMTKLEQKLRQELGLSAKFKKTITQMLVEKNEIDRY